MSTVINAELVSETIQPSSHDLVFRTNEHGVRLVQDLSLGKFAGYQRPYNIRRLIEGLITSKFLNESEIFSVEEKIEKSPSNPLGAGRSSTEYWFTREQALIVLARGASPIAPRVMQELVDAYSEKHGWKEPTQAITKRPSELEMIAQLGQGLGKLALEIMVDRNRVSELAVRVEQYSNALDNQGQELRRVATQTINVTQRVNTVEDKLRGMPQDAKTAKQLALDLGWFSRTGKPNNRALIAFGHNKQLNERGWLVQSVFAPSAKHLAGKGTSSWYFTIEGIKQILELVRIDPEYREPFFKVVDSRDGHTHYVFVHLERDVRGVRT